MKIEWTKSSGVIIECIRNLIAIGAIVMSDLNEPSIWSLCILLIISSHISICTWYNLITYIMQTYTTTVLTSFWSSDAIQWHRFGSSLAQLMTCCLTVSSHYLNRCWLNIGEVLWHLPIIIFSGNVQDICRWYEFETTSSRLQMSLPGTIELSVLHVMLSLSTKRTMLLPPTPRPPIYCNIKWYFGTSGMAMFYWHE